MPAISVIVPVYKTEQYLHRCVDSILNQTFSDFELILVDDGSPDNCPAICEEYAQNDSRVRVIHQENQGQAAARNHGVRVAQGQWVSFVDSDDMVHPQLLEHLYRAADSTNAGAAVCGAYEAEEIPADFEKPVDGKPVVYDITEEYLIELFRNGKNKYWCVWAVLHKTQVIRQNPLTLGRIYEDNAVACQWLYTCGKVADVNAALYFYRVNPTGTTKNTYSLRQTDYLWALEKQIHFYKKVGYRKMVQIVSEELILHSTYHAQKIYERDIPRKHITPIIWRARRYLIAGGIPLLKRLRNRNYVLAHLMPWGTKIYSAWFYRWKKA